MVPCNRFFEGCYEKPELKDKEHQSKKNEPNYHDGLLLAAKLKRSFHASSPSRIPTAQISSPRRSIMIFGSGLGGGP